MDFEDNKVHEDHKDPWDVQETLEPRDLEEILDLQDHQDQVAKTLKDQIPREKWLVSLMDHLALTSSMNTKMDQLDLWDHPDLLDHKDLKEHLVPPDHQDP
jgi:hypothetical protein